MVTYPEDWNIKTLSELGFCYSGLSGKKAEDFGGGNSLYVTFLNVLKNVALDTDIFEKVRINPLERQNEVRNGDLFFNTSSETPEEIGMCATLTKDINNVYLNSFCFGFRRFSSDDLFPMFASYFFSSKCGRHLMTFCAQGSTRYNLSKKFFLQMKLRLPSLPEQQAIASTLSNFDEHIDNLTELIEKKKAIRDGALEDLVSGRTRLGGFNGEWETTRLSDFAQINPSSALPEVFRYVDLESVKGISLLGWRVERKETAPSRAQRLAQKKDIFFQTVRPYQRNNYLFELPYNDFVFSTGYAQIRTKNNANFLFRLLRQDAFVDEVLDNCTGTSYPAINPTQLGEIEIFVPKDPKEQQAIAEILTAMDEEIESLEEEKAKMMQIREGAMDDLLTGRVRLKV